MQRCWVTLHERKVLGGFVAEFGDWDPATGHGVYDVVPAEAMDRATLAAKHAESIGALRAGADVVFQAAFFDGQFHGRSDFLVRQSDGSYAVFDTKLARHAKVTALLQLAAYGDQLLKAGIPVDPAVTLVLGSTVQLPGGGFDYVRSHHKLSEILPVFRERRERFLALTAAHIAQPGTVGWGAPGLTACGRCDYCQEQVKATDDLLLVARMNSVQRKNLHERGISSVTDLAQATLAKPTAYAPAPAGTGADAERRRPCRRRRPVPQGRRRAHHPLRRPARRTPWPSFPRRARAIFSSTSKAIRCGRNSATGVWGLEYLFGVIEAPDASPASRGFPAVLGPQPGGGEAGVPRFPRLRRETPAGLPGHARLPLRRL